MRSNTIEIPSDLKAEAVKKLESKLGLPRPYRIGRPSARTSKGTPYVTIGNRFCPKPEGCAVPGVPFRDNAQAALDVAVDEFVETFRGYAAQHQQPGEKVVWRVFPEVCAWKPVDPDTWEPLEGRTPELYIRARFCFEAP